MGDRMDTLQMQIDSLDLKLNEMREDQMRANIDPKPLILEQIENMMQVVDQKYAPKALISKQVDSLGEEIAADINSLERQLQVETERIENLLQSTATLHDDLKICQISIAKMPIHIDSNRENETFSETLVKKLLRQGEDRKTSIEETKMLSAKIQEVKLT